MPRLENNPTPRKESDLWKRKKIKILNPIGKLNVRYAVVSLLCQLLACAGHVLLAKLKPLEGIGNMNNEQNNPHELRSAADWYLTFKTLTEGNTCDLVFHPTDMRKIADCFMKLYEQCQATNNDWQDINTAPPYTTLLLCAEATEYSSARYGIGLYSEWKDGKIVFDWKWSHQPTHYKLLTEPKTLQSKQPTTEGA